MEGAKRQGDPAEVSRALRQVESYLREAERQLVLTPDPAAVPLVRAISALTDGVRQLASGVGRIDAGTMAGGEGE